KFNFILLHYIYLISMTLIGSILLFPTGGMHYIDALFFAAGGATQSGLNTIDVNKLKLYQQIILVIIPSLCNPIAINTFVVFVRLYWFEKRFQNIVRDARELRSRTRSRTKTEEKRVPDLDQEERGVNGRQITVIRNGNASSEPSKAEGKQPEASEPTPSTDKIQDFAADQSPTRKSESSERPPASPFHRDIVFADELPSPSRDTHHETRFPHNRSREQHIAFLENQRNPKDKAALRIPGPRDVERGDVPQRVEEGEDANNMDRWMSRDQHPQTPALPGELNWDDHPVKEEYAAENSESLAYRLRTKLPKWPTGSTSGLRKRAMSRMKTFPSFLSQDRGQDDPLPYLSYTATIGRNSTFVDLTEEQREELGGIEYRSLKTLAWVLIAYQAFFFALGIITLLPWILHTGYAMIVRADGVSAVWWGFFTPISMFTDLGFTLTPESMIPFQKAVLPLLVGTFLIIIGNTGFPCMLRFVIWGASLVFPRGSGIWEELRFLLDHPRRCFTLLFPRKATWWLFGVLVLLNGLDLIFFVLLDLKDPVVTSLPPGFQFLDGLFQAASTRTAGFAVINLADLHPAIQVSYLIMMYISVFPIAISIRQTNVYEENSLGIYHDSSSPDDASDETSYLSAHLRRQLSFDLWYVFLGLFLICIVEGARIQNRAGDDYAFTTFSLLFEIVSAYGTVGLSLGYPNTNTSFSAQLKPLSKLIIIAMMLRGRHRGLPYALDRAILLPSESLQRKEGEYAAAVQRQRRAS
ncbi:hypothetical protein EJ06DRAFT_454849, partial [Trichodelitschia bisporula]